MKAGIFQYSFNFQKTTAILVFLSNSAFLSSSAQDSILKDTSINDVEESQEIEQQIEYISENSDEELDYTQLIEDIRHFESAPLNLNTASPEEMRQLHFLNDVQIYNLIKHIQENGKLISLNELQSVDGFDAELINRIMPYVTIESALDIPQFHLKKIIQEGENDFFIRYQRTLEEQKGYTPFEDAEDINSRYPGGPEKIYMRYRFTYLNNISCGITAEKDPGEEFFTGTQKNGFDFYSAHFFMRNMGKIKALAIGDYNAQFGQGLTLWTGLSFGRSGEVAGFKKSPQGFSPYTSTDENEFMRGVATTIEIKKLEISVFYSQKHVDANISGIDSLTNDILYVSSLQSGGLHRKPSEVEDKDALGQTIFGTHIAFKNRQFNIGATACKTIFDSEIKKDMALYNQFDFTGKENINTGIDYNYYIKTINIFGEVARSDNGGMGFINGLLMVPDPHLTFSLVHRKYDKDYQSIYSNAFGENSNNSNEEGICIGVNIKAGSKWAISAYNDNFNFPWLKYRVDAPSHGTEYMTQITYAPSKQTEMYFRFRQQNRNLNSADGSDYINYIEKTIKRNYRCNFSYQVSPSFRLKNRVEFVDYRTGDSPAKYGYLIFQDVSYKNLKSPFSFSCRYALFDADSYDESIYAYENDVLYGYSIPAYYYRGSRFYIVIKYEVSRNVDIWLRYAQSYYSNRSTIGTDLDEIDGNIKSEIKVQMRVKF